MDVTYNFTAGTRAVAGQVNQNFADVKSAVDPLETAIADIQTELEGGFILPDGSVDFTRLQSYATYTVSNATNATPIVITAVAHSFLTGDKVQISGVGGNTAANGVFTITKISTDTFSLDDSVGNGTFDTSGTAIIIPVDAGNLISKAYLDANAGALKINALGTVSTNITLDTNTVTTADVSGVITITLPTTLVAENENTVVFDFSTTSSSSPTINQDATTISITAASNATPIVITAVGHGFNTGDKVYITGVLGNTAANGTWIITRLTADTFSLNGSVGNGAYTSGGTVRKASFKWSDKNSGKVPSAYSTISGVRNILVFKTHDGGVTWEAEYTTFGGVEANWAQPILTADGTLGGTSFAVYNSNPYAGDQTTYGGYRAFDGGTTTSALFTGTSNYIYYFPQALKMATMSWVLYDNTFAAFSWVLYGSNNNIDYTTLHSGSFANGGATRTLEIPISNRQFYKYYKMTCVLTSGYSGSATTTIVGTYIST